MRQSAGWAWRPPSWLLCLSGTFAAAVLAFGSALFYLKLHENELVFRTAISHTRTTGQLPPGAEPLVIQGPAALSWLP